jgi:hypothetical protein
MSFRNAALTRVLAIAALLVASGAASAKDMPGTTEVVTRVLAVDLEAKQIRTSDGAGASQSLRVIGKPADRLGELPIGRTFKLTLQDTDDGTRKEVVAIKLARHVPQP